MRGGLDDALDKLARRDELRRRATGDGSSTPPAVTELVEAIAGVVARHPSLNVTVGVEGAGDPTLLHFAFADGVVQVNADHAVAARADDVPPPHADFVIDVEEPEEPPVAYGPRGHQDDQDRFGPTADYDYPDPPTAESPFVAPAAQAQHTGERPFVAPPANWPRRPEPSATQPGQPITPDRVPGETTREDLAARLAQARESAPNPFAAAAPPPPPTTPAAFKPQPPPAYIERPGPASPYAAPASAPPFPTAHAEPQHTDATGGFEQLREPIPLQVERPEETEMAARRLAALLRSNPSLLDNPPE
ncbi:hypothetical protein [Actinoplanes sp. NBRC 101535]|uniref:hypothetical protein n=1 Tax=Actinoplanes sp. NBRC 101535 TaxID=3032196 RepID=UPI0024A502E6|nr:hypothetical protein [Actinoplanes sp. NBRC 101535]GLY05147.1 hypothetical protein Acsp01_55260 [Actinoplanes sp. NBRC 101535]